MENKTNINLNENAKSSLSLENRKKLLLTGVLEVLSFNEDEISLNSTLGALNIKGKNLKLNKLDVQNGDVIISGYVNSIVYSSKQAKKKKNHKILKKVFKRG